MSELSREEIIERLHGNIDRIAEMVIDAEQRAQRAEAECERLRESVKFTEDWYATRWARLRDLVKESAPDLWPDVASVMANGTASPSEPPTYAQRLNYYRHRAEKAERALTTPPPEKPQAPTIEELHEERKRWRPDAPQTPEQTECASCGEGMPRDECPESKRPCGHHCNHSWTQDICHWCGKEFGEETDEPQQAHGDALAALDTLVDAATDESGWLWPDVAEHEAGKIRRHLTASGVPGHWACKNPGRADQYRAEAMACRRALGFDAESHDVSPTDLTSAIADSGVPESVRELPAEWENGTEGMTDSAAAAYRCCARALRFALASAPAVCEWHKPDPETEIYETACGSGFETPAGMLMEELPCVRYCSNCGRRIHIAAAPTDGREHD